MTTREELTSPFVEMLSLLTPRGAVEEVKYAEVELVRREEELLVGFTEHYELYTRLDRSIIRYLLTHYHRRKP